MATYYIDPVNGNDADDGLSWANAFLTLNGAEDEPVAAGDVVYVGPGVYREQLTVDVSGGNTYVVGTVDVTNGSKQVDGNGTAWVANVAADYMFHIAIYASGNDGVTNGDNTFTSAGGNFQAGMIGKVIQINTKGAYLIATVVNATSITISDPNGLGWPADGGGGLTYSVMSGEGHYDIDSVDDNTTIQLKQPWNGPTLTAIAYITFNPIRYIADVTGEDTDGVGGIVRITGSDTDQTATRTYCIYGDEFDYRVFRGFALDMATSYAIRAISCEHWVIEDIFVQSGGIIGISSGYPANTIRRCIILSANIAITLTGASDSANVVENCLTAVAKGDNVSMANVGGSTIRNCILMSGSDGIDMTASPAVVGQTLVVNNCVITDMAGNAMEAAALGDIVEDYNTLWGNGALRFNVGVGANSVIYPLLFMPPILYAGADQISGFKFPWWFGELSEWSQIQAITGAFEAYGDLHGIMRPVTASKRSWGALQFADMERETGTKHAGAASLCLHDAGRHQIFVPVTNTSTTISVYVYREANYAGSLPQMIIKQPGQADDVTTDAAAASQWNLLTTTLTPAADPPYVVVELVSRNTNGANDEVFFDDLVVS